MADDNALAIARLLMNPLGGAPTPPNQQMGGLLAGPLAALMGNRASSMNLGATPTWQPLPLGASAPDMADEARRAAAFRLGMANPPNARIPTPQAGTMFNKFPESQNVEDRRQNDTVWNTLPFGASIPPMDFWRGLFMQPFTPMRDTSQLEQPSTNMGVDAGVNDIKLFRR